MRCRRCSCCLLGVATAGISIFAAGYFREGQGAAPGLLCLQYHVFLASMAMVLLADDAYAFMVAWETMALSSYFLVTTQHRLPEIRSAGFLYLLIAHVGAIGILLGFGVMQGGSWQFTFDAMRGAELSPAWASVAFGLMVFGFGAKAGLLPVHVWLPEAHPAAPSPVSALMSGVMLKTAIYGFLRVSFDLLPAVQWWWGGVLLVLGLATASFGVIFAAVQSDMKRLLAYSSIENIGIIFAGIGLTIVFSAIGHGRAVRAGAGRDALPRAEPRLQFKSLLFLVTGSVLHATAQRNLGRLGGLIRRMPWVAWPGAGRHAGDRRAAAVERFHLRVAAAADLPVHARPCRTTSPTCWCRSAPRRSRWPRARGLRDGQVLRRDLPRPPRETALAQAHDAGWLRADRHGLAGRAVHRAGTVSRCSCCERWTR